MSIYSVSIYSVLFSGLHGDLACVSIYSERTVISSEKSAATDGENVSEIKKAENIERVASFRPSLGS